MMNVSRDKHQRWRSANHQHRSAEVL